MTAQHLCGPHRVVMAAKTIGFSVIKTIFTISSMNRDLNKVLFDNLGEKNLGQPWKFWLLASYLFTFLITYYTT